MRSLARGGSLNLAGAASNGLLQLAFVAIVTNVFPARSAGLFFAATSAFLIGGALAELGASTGVVRFVPAYLATGRGADVRTALRVALIPVVVVGVLVGAATWALAPSLAGLIGGDAADEVLVPVLRVLGIFLPVSAAYEVVLAGTRAYGSMRPSVFVDKFGRMAALPLAALGVHAFGLGLVALAWAWSAPYLAALAIAAVALQRQLRRPHAPKPSGEPDEAAPDQPARHWREVAGEFWRYTSTRAVARVFQVALQRADIIMVAALRSPTEAAIYTAATRLVVLGQLGVQAVVRVLQPQISRLLAVGDHEAAQAAYRTTTTWSVALTWPIYLLSIAAAPLLLSLFGSGYSGGQATLTVLGLAMLFAVATGPVDVMLLMAGRSQVALLNTGTALAVDIGLNLVLIPRYGVLGAAISWAAAIVTANGMAVLQVRRSMGMTPTSRPLAYVAASAAVCFGLLPWAARLVSDSAAVVVPWMLACIVLYAVALWARRDALDLDAFRPRGRHRKAA